MNNDVETVDVEYEFDDIYAKQKEDVQRMRASLLACNPESSTQLRTAINNITAMRIYHQLARIIRYTEIMDEIEQKTYSNIRNALNVNSSDPNTLIMLLKAQEQLQKSMIESHKLLQPYLDISSFDILSYVEEAKQSSDISPNVKILDSSSRDKIRVAAGNALLQLRPPTGTEG